jgi:hypothetical protein
MNKLLFVESFDLRLSNQYILVRVIPSCLCQVSPDLDTWTRVLYKRSRPTHEEGIQREAKHL